jgi:hypothetical protein
MPSAKEALDGAKLVKFDESGRTCVAWFGGTTFNVYNPQTWEELTCFNYSDEKGCALEVDVAELKANNWLVEEGF